MPRKPSTAAPAGEATAQVQRPPGPRAYSYLRFSTPDQIKGDSFRRQSSMAVEYATRNGLTWDTSLTFHDLGVSAYRGRNAEEGRLGDFLEAVQVGLVPRGSYLLVEALDRLSRMTPRKALRVLERICEEGITVVTLNDGKAYTDESLDTDQVGLIMAIVYFMRANEESATKARRLRAAWTAKRAKALDRPLTSTVPAWLRLDKESGKIEAIPERAAIVKGIFKAFLAGHGKEAIAQDLNRQGAACFGRAKHWQRSYVHKIIGNPACFGQLVPHAYDYSSGRKQRTPTGEPLDGYYPAVVTRETFEQAQDLDRGAAYAGKPRAGYVVSLLAGLAVCPLCGSTMTRVVKGDRKKAGPPKLVCVKAKAGAGCVYHGVNLEEVEGAIIDKAAQIVADAPMGPEGLEDELQQVLNNVEATEGQIAALLDVLADGPSPAARAKLAELEQSMQGLTMARDDLLSAVGAAAGPLLRKRLDALEAALTGPTPPSDRQKANAALRMLLRSVVIDYPTGELRLQWKHAADRDTAVQFAWPKG